MHIRRGGKRRQVATKLVQEGEVLAKDGDFPAAEAKFQAALALEASRSRERMEQRLRELDALYRISQLAAGQRDLDSVLAGMLAVAQDLLPAGQAAILLLEGPEGPLRLRAARGYGPGAGELVIGLGEGVTGRCAQTGDVQLVDDVAQHPDYIPGVPGAVSELAVPLLAEGRVIGVLNAESAERAARPA